jgi:hypothetical protein
MPATSSSVAARCTYLSWGRGCDEGKLGRFLTINNGGQASGIIVDSGGRESLRSGGFDANVTTVVAARLN